MPLSPMWKKPGTRVLTPVGAGALGGRLRGRQIEIRLDQPWAGENTSFHSPGEIILDTDFTLLRILNVDAVGIIASAVNLPTWDQGVLAQMAPYAEDETLFALNFATREAVCARIWNHLGDYHIVTAGMDRHLKMFPWVAETREDAIEIWEREVAPVTMTGQALIIFILIALEDDVSRILARKVVGTASVLKDERYY